MKKQLIIVLILLIVLRLIIVLYINNANKIEKLTQTHNEKYEQYYNKQIIGATLISIINETINYNENIGITKVDNYYIDNNQNSIHITIKFLEDDRIIKMEDIAKGETENFVKFFSVANFKCTEIKYHQNTNKVKSLHFEQISN